MPPTAAEFDNWINNGLGKALRSSLQDIVKGPQAVEAVHAILESVKDANGSISSTRLDIMDTLLTKESYSATKLLQLNPLCPIPRPVEGKSSPPTLDQNPVHPVNNIVLHKPEVQYENAIVAFKTSLENFDQQVGPRYIPLRQIFIPRFAALEGDVNNFTISLILYPITIVLTDMLQWVKEKPGSSLTSDTIAISFRSEVYVDERRDSDGTVQEDERDDDDDDDYDEDGSESSPDDSESTESGERTPTLETSQETLAALRLKDEEVPTTAEASSQDSSSSESDDEEEREEEEKEEEENPYQDAPLDLSKVDHAIVLYVGDKKTWISGRKLVLWENKIFGSIGNSLSSIIKNGIQGSPRSKFNKVLDQIIRYFEISKIPYIVLSDSKTHGAFTFYIKNDDASGFLGKTGGAFLCLDEETPSIPEAQVYETLSHIIGGKNPRRFIQPIGMLLGAKCWMALVDQELVELMVE